MRRSDGGFGLMAALFLLLVLSAAAAFMLNLSGIERRTVNLSLVGTHAYHAARAGVQWGLWQLDDTGACFADTDLSLTEGGLNGFDVNVTCTSTDHSEAMTTSTVYQIVAIAEYRSYGDGDYARRRLAVTVSDAP